MAKSNVSAQQKVIKYFKDKNEEICDSINAKHIDYYFYSDTIANTGLIRRFDIDGSIKNEYSYSNLSKKIKHGIAKDFGSNGEIKKISNYEFNELNGELKSYFKDGTLKRIENYRNGKMENGKCFTKAGLDTAYYEYEIMPRYIGGEQALFEFLKHNIKYPKKARKKEIQGTVYVGFVIGKMGEVKNVHIVKSVYPLLDDEALRVVSLQPNWSIGYLNGDATSVQFTLPIKFILK